MEKRFVIAALFLAFHLIAHAQDHLLEKKLDSLLTKNFKREEPGIAVLVARKGKIIYQKAFGSANMELDVPMQPDMVFRVGSITKQFTAIAILQLVEQGKISLQDSLQKFIPWFPSRGHTITIEHLLTHTSGLHEYMTINHPDPYIKRHDISLQIIIDHFKDAPLDFEPGTKYNYTNSGYALLGAIIEKVSGKPYHQYMKENVLERAGLKHTSYAKESEIIPKRVTGYTRDAGYYENTYYETTSLGIAAGDLLSTMPDLLQWHQALKEEKLIKKPLLEKAQSRYRLKNGNYINYGYGWLLDSLFARKCIYHAGQVSGFITFEWYFPDEEVFVALSTNVKSGEDQTEFSSKRYRVFYQVPFTVFDKKVPGEIVLNNAVLDRYVGKYQMGEGNVSIYRENNQLYLLFRTSFALHPIGENWFFAPDAPNAIRVEFKKDKTGKVTQMLVYQNEVYTWDRVN